MTLVDDLAVPVDAHERARRRFLALVGLGALGTAGAALTVGSLRFLWPEVEFREERRVVLGRPEEIAADTVLVVPRHQLYVVRTATTVFALSSVCTHLGCATTYVNATQTFFCPCHGSRFARDGAVEAGPAPRPLTRLHVALDDGRIVVDASQRVGDDFALEVG